jgi:3-oxoacyl-[acyl-carrier-protein] synthase II
MLDNLPEDEKDRMGVIAGCTVPEFEDMVELATTLKTEGFDKTNPYISSKLMHQCLPTLLSIRYGLTGPNTSVMTACSTSLHAVGDSFRMIRDGCADFILATGVHPYLTPGIIAGFMRANAVCMKFQDDPKAGSRPFDRERSGIVPSEATGAVILEVCHY